jgi:hypothetical protein
MTCLPSLERAIRGYCLLAAACDLNGALRELMIKWVGIEGARDGAHLQSIIGGRAARDGFLKLFDTEVTSLCTSLEQQGILRSDRWRVWHTTMGVHLSIASNLLSEEAHFFFCQCRLADIGALIYDFQQFANALTPPEIDARTEQNFGLLDAEWAEAKVNGNAALVSSD